ncbi:MAG TPA: ribosome silencing factor [Gemmatimonadaceae bacterium]|nr:ribosome silencing factor [Gemmatimonadaceae bacterium]
MWPHTSVSRFRFNFSFPFGFPFGSPGLPKPEQLARAAAALCVDLKAHDVVALDLRGITDMTDFFVIASGTSDTHVRSIAQHVIDGMGLAGTRVLHVEGMSQGRWVLLDFVDLVVHVFHPTMRDFYQLERLWSDARNLEVEPQGAAT